MTTWALRHFGAVAREQQAVFRTTLSAAARQPTDDKGKRHGHLLAHGSEVENLYPGLRGPGGALEFFAERRIPWWRSSRSGDRRADPAYPGPTRNLASSQVSCVNFLLPLASIPGALPALLQLIDPEVIDVEMIVDSDGFSSPVEFEWVGWLEPLEGGRKTRGAMVTSIDALMVGQTRSGRRAYLFEWKYCEEYLRPENKGEGTKGNTRAARYRHLYESQASSFNGAIPFEDLLYDPFYQLTRMLLLGDRMLSEGLTEALRVDDFRIVVVCPTANQAFRHVAPKTPIGKRLPPTTTVTDAVAMGLQDARRIEMAAQDQLVAALRRGQLRGELEPWLAYHALRYGW
ncbi:MAG: hypothetical protein RL685_1606 [Pseudomonadota bacterium]|jgi:hypothetical protein